MCSAPVCSPMKGSNANSTKLELVEHPMRSSTKMVNLLTSRSIILVNQIWWV